MELKRQCENCAENSESARDMHIEADEEMRTMDITRQVRCCARAWDGTRERGVEGERDGERGGESETQHEMLMDHVLLHSTPQR